MSAASLIGSLVWLLGVCAAAHAQDEIIVDPELEDPPPPPPPPEPGLGDGAELRALLHSRLGVDLDWEPGEDVWEGLTVARLEATYRRSESLKFVLGARLQHMFGVERDSNAEGGASRTHLDAVVSSGYADARVLPGLHVRGGYQTLQRGRLQSVSATNVLAVNDLRPGLLGTAASSQVGQPALRVDWDITPWLSLGGVYVPFFQPHLVSFVDSDYALFAVSPALEAEIVGADGLNRVRRELGRSGLIAWTESGIRAAAPEPDLSRPQGLVSLAVHGPSGELALTLATAIDKLPAFDVARSVQDVLRDPEDGAAQLQAGMLLHPVDIRYDRYHVLALDGAKPLGPVQLGAELAYVPGRTLHAAQTECTPKDEDECVFYAPEPERADLLQAGLAVELVEGFDWVALVEIFGMYALQEPPGDARRWLTFDRGRYYYGGVATGAWSPEGTGFSFALAGGVLSGPSYVLTPRIEYTLLERLTFEVGASLVGGADPSGPADTEAPLGGTYEGTDQAFVGVRWLP